MPFRITHRQEKLLETFIRHDGYITSEYLSKKLKVSPRTIRQDIKQLSAELSKNGITLIAVPSKGYLLPQRDIKKTKNFLEAQKPVQSSIPILPLDRNKYIIRELLFRRRTIFIQELTEDLCISSSTAEKDIQEVRKWLENYDLQLTNEKLSGFRVKGSEISNRFAMINYFWSFHNDSTSHILDEAVKIFSANTIEPIKKIVYRLHDKEGIYLSDADYCNLTLYLSAAIQRIKAGYEIKDNPSPSKTTSENEQTLAATIRSQINEDLSIQFSQLEVEHLANYFKHTNIFSGKSSNNESVFMRNPSHNFIAAALEGLSPRFKLDLSEDIDLVNSLSKYLDSLIKRKNIKTQVSKPTLEGISKEYPVAFEMAVAISEIIKKKFDLSLDQHEIGSIALYICAAIERLLTRENHVEKIVVVIICATGAGGSQLMAAKAQRYFQDIEIAGIYPSYRLDEAIGKAPDLIVSTIPINELTHPVVQISHLLTKEDHNKVRIAIDKLKAARKKPDLARLFQTYLFFSRVDIPDWREALTFLCGKIQERGFAGQDFTESVIKRESVFPTAIGNLVAIPHAFTFQKGESWIAVGILNKPIQWGDEMVQLILLLNIDHLSEGDYKTIFETLYEKLSDKKIIKKLINCGDFECFIKEMNE